MRTLSVFDFKKLCDELPSSRYLYDTENQPSGFWDDCQFSETYSDVICMLNPDRICFKNENGTLCLNRVKLIQYEDFGQNNGALNIICGDPNNDKNLEDNTYVVIFEKNIY